MFRTSLCQSSPSTILHTTQNLPMMVAFHEDQTVLAPQTSRITSVTSAPMCPRHHNSGVRDQRVRFALFVKVLFKYLDASGEVFLSAQGRELVRTSTKMNRCGHPSYWPLLDTLEKRLRELVGEVHWRRSHAYMRYYLSRSNRRSASHNKAWQIQVASSSGVSFPVLERCAQGSTIGVSPFGREH